MLPHRLEKKSKKKLFFLKKKRESVRAPSWSMASGRDQRRLAATDPLLSCCPFFCIPYGLSEFSLFFRCFGMATTLQKTRRRRRTVAVTNRKQKKEIRE